MESTHGTHGRTARAVEVERSGVCEDTGGDIPFERLDVIPWARTCDQAGG
jgi:RNA polymerase-binding transcription factor DksA